MTRHIGAFIQNTIKPLIEELDKLLGKCEHLKFGKEELYILLNGLVRFEMDKIKLYCLVYLILGTEFCLVVYLILGGNK